MGPVVEAGSPVVHHASLEYLVRDKVENQLFRVFLKHYVS